jgi:hypothetical protein
MNKSLSLVAALAAVVLTGSTFAYTPKDSHHQSAVAAIKLTPSKVVMPTNLPRSFLRAGQRRERGHRAPRRGHGNVARTSYIPSRSEGWPWTGLSFSCWCLRTGRAARAAGRSRS